MRNLLYFIIRYGTWFVFAFYVLISCILLFINNSYQRAVFLTSANVVTSTINSATTTVSGYFNLKSINESLQESNARLENEVLNLRHQIAEYRTLLSDSAFSSVYNKRFDFVSATVVGNSVSHPQNYFSINRGKLDGVKTGMGVVDQNGIVGIVNVAGNHTARVISVLNETQKFSVKIKNTHFIGSLSWKGGDPSIAYMEEVPRHAKFHMGDTIVTSGYSLSFPENIPVGTVLNRIKGSDDNFFILKIQLSPDFKNLSTVRVIKDDFKEDLDSLSRFDLNR